MRLRLRTCYCLHVLGLFGAGEKDDILLRCLDILVFENEELLNAILLERAEFDE